MEIKDLYRIKIDVNQDQLPAAEPAGFPPTQRSFTMNATATTLIMVIGIGILLAMAIYFGSGYPPER